MQLPGISKMFMNEMTLVSAWIHLLAVDLFAARYFHDNLNFLFQIQFKKKNHFFNVLFFCEYNLHSVLIHSFLMLFRQVYFDGIENNVETRHSVSLCLLFCPIGILIHAITKVLTEAYSH